MDRTQYDGLVAQSAYERRMQVGKTGIFHNVSKSGSVSQIRSNQGGYFPGSVSRISRFNSLSLSLLKITTWANQTGIQSKRSHRSAIGLPVINSQSQSSSQNLGKDQSRSQGKNSFAGLQREFSYGKRPESQHIYVGNSKSLREKLEEHEIKIKSTAPKTVAHPLTITKEDVDMANKHATYKAMTPSERLKQDEWANKLFDTHTPCPDQYTWEPAADGYQCKGGKHFITHLLVQELKQGLFIVPYGSPICESDGATNKRNEDNSRGYIKTRWGPYYPHPDYVKIFMYSGPLDKPIPHGCPVTQGGDPSPEDANETNDEHRGQSPDKRLQLWLQFCAENGLEFSMELDNGSKGQPQIGPAKQEILKQILNERAKSAAKNIAKAASQATKVPVESPTQMGRRAVDIGRTGTSSHQSIQQSSGSQTRRNYHPTRGDSTYHKS